MPDEQLKVGITGDASGLEEAARKAGDALTGIGEAGKKSSTALSKTLGQLQDQLKRFQAGLKDATTTESFSRIQRAIDATKQRIDLLNDINSFQGVKKGSNEATQALTNLSRVAQDAPYGFIGIANNINPLLESFQRLQTETGGTGAAIKALGSELLGAGGLGLAVGIVSSLLVVFSKDLFGAKSGSDDLAKSFDHLADSSNNAVESVQNLQSILSSVSGFQDLTFKISGKGQAAFLKEELNSIETLRDEASKNLKFQRDRDLFAETDYFNQSQELRDKIDAQIKQHNDNVTKLDSELQQWNERVRLQKLKIQLQEKQDQEDADKKAEQQRKKAQEKATEDQREALRKLQELLKEREKIIAEFSEDFSSVGVLNLPDLPDALVPINKGTNEKLVGFFREQLRDALLKATHFLPQIEIPSPKIVIGDKSDKFSILNQLKSLLPDPTVQAIDPLKVPIPLKPAITWQPSDFQKQYEGFLKQIQDLIEQTEENIAITLGEGIGDLISGKGLEDTFQKIAGIMGDFLQSLGKLLIRHAIEVQLFQKAFAALFNNPALGLAVGVGLIAAGQLIKNAALPKPKHFAEGGLVSGPTYGLIGEGMGTSRTNPEVIAPLDKLKNFIKPVQNTVSMPQGQWRLRGRDLVFAVEQTQKSQRRAT